MPEKWDRQFENQEFKIRRVAMIRQGKNHAEIDQIFLAEIENEVYSKMSYSEIQEGKRLLEQQKEQFEETKKLWETHVQESLQEYEDKKAKIIQECELRQRLFDSSGLGVIAKKVQFVCESAEKQGLTDETLVLCLYFENGEWKSTSGSFREKASDLMKKLGDS